MPNVYQINGFDLPNTTSVEGDTGRSMLDSLAFEETARETLERIKRVLSKFQLEVAVHSHSYSDHWRRVHSAIKADNRAGILAIIAPGDSPSNRRSVPHAGCHAVSRRFSRTMDDGQVWIC